MFARYTYIDPKHVVPLEATVRNHSIVSAATAPLLAKMYKTALDALSSGEPVREEGFAASVLKSETVTLSSVTEAKTGLYIQMAKLDGKVYMTVGQKWVMEQPNPAHGNVTTSMW
jgi:hypothetical protein